MSFVFKVKADCLSNSGLWVIVEYVLPLCISPVVISSASLNVCPTFLSVSSTTSPWSISRLELYLGQIAVTHAGVLWLIGDDRLRFFLSKACTELCTCTGLGVVVL